jgi:hypothetical protein
MPIDFRDWRATKRATQPAAFLIPSLLEFLFAEAVSAHLGVVSHLQRCPSETFIAAEGAHGGAYKFKHHPRR